MPSESICQELRVSRTDAWPAPGEGRRRARAPWVLSTEASVAYVVAAGDIAEDAARQAAASAGADRLRQVRTRSATAPSTTEVWRLPARVSQVQDPRSDRVLRTETCCNDTYHFSIGRRLENLPPLHGKLTSANARCLELQAELLVSPVDAGQFAALATPTLIGQRRIPGLKLHDGHPSTGPCSTPVASSATGLPAR